MNDDKLSAFVTAAKARGLDDASLVALLRQQGWQEQRIYRSLTSYYRETLGIEIPARGNRAEDARDAFYHLIAFVTLGGWVVALINLIFGLIDRAFVQLYGYAPTTHDLAWHIATIVIAFPIYLWINALIAREATARPESLQSGVRKWLTYIALVIAAIVLIGDGVWMLATFLTGAATAAFVLKSLTVLAITGGTFGYYIGSVRSNILPTWRNRFYGGAALIAVVVALIFGFAPIGTPFHQQDVTGDNAILGHLYDLATTANADRNASGSHDIPATLPGAKPGEYRRINANRYTLCSTFAAASNPAQETATVTWSHPAGNYCFNLDARQTPPTVPYYN